METKNRILKGSGEKRNNFNCSSSDYSSVINLSRDKY